MINKKLGFLFIILAIVLGFILVMLNGGLKKEAEILGCFERTGCVEIQESLTLTHFAFGIIGFILALGFYLVFFYTGEKEILQALERQKNRDFELKKFDIILSVLDKYEAQILQIVKEAQGISQRTVVLRSGLSKSKVSEVIKSLEAKNLVKKQKKGKSNDINYIK